ncbi:MAG: autotransporter assembly complex protein TamA [Ostreibacterium sp.]
MIKVILLIILSLVSAIAIADNQTKVTTISATANTDEDPAETEKNPSTPILHVTLSGLSEESLRNNAEAFLTLYADRNKAIKNRVYTRYLATSGAAQIQQALQPFGYYRVKVDTVINENQNDWTVNYKISKGRPITVSKLTVDIEGEGHNNPDFTELVMDYPLKKGDILEQEKYTNFKNELVKTAATDGFFDANFTQKKIVLADDLLSAEIILIYNTGKRYQFGQVKIQQDFLDQDVFDRYKTFESGEVYSSKFIANLQRDLYNSGYIKTIDATVNRDQQDKKVPVLLKIKPKKNKKHTFSIGYGTDSGVRGKYNFDWRWVNRRGHKFKSTIFTSQKQSKIGLEYVIPGQLPAYDNYKIFANVERDRRNDIDSSLWNVGGAYSDKKGHLQRAFGIKWQQENFSIGHDRGDVGLLTPYVHFIYIKSDNPLKIMDGIYLDAYISVAYEHLLSDVSLFQAIGKAKYIKTFADVNRVSLSGGLGRIWTKDFHQLPAAYRFFTGGDKTIRGYSYESIGDKDSSGKVIGGDKSYYMSAEYEYFFRDNMALATFVDAGDAYSSESAKLKVGAGVGFHYYSPIGPIKIDIAHGFDEPGDAIRLHLSVGAEF